MRLRATSAAAGPNFYGDWMLEKVTMGGLDFWIRPDTSDIQSLREVLGRKVYDRYKIGPHEGEHWLDIGANIGGFTCLAASRGVMVEAYEPDPVSLAIARLNVRLNRLQARVRLDEHAVVGQTPENPTLHVNARNRKYWRNSLYHRWRGGFDIPCTTVLLDEILYSWEPGTWNIKLDAEGAEMELIEHSHIEWWGRTMAEWTFEFDRDISRFLRARARLRKHYEEVRHYVFDESVETWPISWNPPVCMFYCWNVAEAS